MQKNAVLAMLFGAALLMPLAVQAEGLYVAAGFGQSLYDDVEAGSGPLKDAKPGSGSIAAGYKLDDTWGAEIGYLHFGKAKYSGTSGTTSVSYQVKTQTFYAAVVGTLPFTPGLSGHGKLGLAINHSKGEFSSVTGTTTLSSSGSETKSSVLAGLGLAYQFTPTLSALLDYTYVGKVSEGDLKVSAVSLGLRYNF